MAGKREKDLRFTRVKLINWRNFREAEVRLSDRAFFVGPNASGKSNFLDALRFLRDLVQPTGGGLGAAVERRGGLSRLRCLQARRTSYIEIEVDLGNDKNLALWGYRLRFSIVGKEKSVSVLEEQIKKDGSIIINHIRPPNAPDPPVFTQTLIQQVGQNKDFRDIADFFASIRYLHVVPQIVRDSRRASVGEDDPFGGDLLRRMKETSSKTRDPRFKRISEALKIAVPQFSELELQNDADGHPHLYASYDHWRPNASKQNEEMFSDGTLRLIGFLWSVAERGGPLLLEEPELSLHDEVVSRLPAMIAKAQRLSGRQVIATTHSMALLDAAGIGLQEVHRLVVGNNGTIIETTKANPKIRALTEGGWPTGQAVLPFTKPDDIEQLVSVDVVSA